MSRSPSATRIWSSAARSRSIPRKLTLARALDRLIDDICDKRISAKSSSLGWLFAKRRDVQAPVRGLYIQGGVGRGKTMLMDMFFELVPVRRKRRVHFNDFMADAHDRINRHRQALKRGESTRTIRSRLSPARWPTRRGCCASTNSRSTTSPTP